MNDISAGLLKWSQVSGLARLSEARLRNASNPRSPTRSKCRIVALEVTLVRESMLDASRFQESGDPLSTQRGNIKLPFAGLGVALSVGIIKDCVTVACKIAPRFYIHTIYFKSQCQDGSNHRQLAHVLYLAFYIT